MPGTVEQADDPSTSSIANLSVFPAGRPLRRRASRSTSVAPELAGNVVPAEDRSQAEMSGWRGSAGAHPSSASRCNVAGKFSAGHRREEPGASHRARSAHDVARLEYVRRRGFQFASRHQCAGERAVYPAGRCDCRRGPAGVRCLAGSHHGSDRGSDRARYRAGAEGRAGALRLASRSRSTISARVSPRSPACAICRFPSSRSTTHS